MQVHMSEDVATIAPIFRARFAPGVLTRLRRRAARAVNSECCGLLIGRMNAQFVDVRGALPVTNAAADAARRFALPSAAVLSGQRVAEAAGLDVVGFYHSHPSGTAEPSSADVRGAPPGYLHVIVANHSVRAWRRTDPDLPLLEVAP